MELIVELQHSSILLLFFATEMKRIEKVFVEENKLHERIILIDSQFAALSRHINCFPFKRMQKSFFLTLTNTENIALKFRIKISINCLPEE